MAQTELFTGGALSVIDYRCEAGPETQPFVERHDRHSVSYVRRGSFAVRSRGQTFDLVAGERHAETAKFSKNGSPLLPHDLAPTLETIMASIRIEIFITAPAEKIWDALRDSPMR